MAQNKHAHTHKKQNYAKQSGTNKTNKPILMLKIMTQKKCIQTLQIILKTCVAPFKFGVNKNKMSFVNYFVSHLLTLHFNN